jgi:hypothetical protein
MMFSCVHLIRRDWHIALRPSAPPHAVPEFSADGADGRGLYGSPSALIRVIRGQISFSSAALRRPVKSNYGLVAALLRQVHLWLIRTEVRVKLSFFLL